MICRRYTVRGHVQGVYFRASTKHRADMLGVTGHAINRADGTVEVLACGTPEDVEALEEWLHRGPDAARVDTVTCEACPNLADVPAGFSKG